MGIGALPGPQIAEAVKTARAGGDKPAALPAVKPADIAKARRISASKDVVAWSVGADPVPSPKAGLAPQPIQLQTKTVDIGQILFSSGDAARAVTISETAPNALSSTKVLRAESYDLATCKFLGACNLAPIEKPAKEFPFPQARKSIIADVSPDGTRLLIRHPEDTKRIDLFNLADGKHVVGWRPHDDAAESIAMLSADQALTCSSGKLILWKLPECEAVYIAEGYRGAIQLSPGRKYVAASTAFSIHVLECASGEVKGQLEQPGGPPGVFTAAAFSRDGKEFAACLWGKKLARWNLADGKHVGAVPGAAGDRAMAFMGSYVLHGGLLFDWNMKTGPIWNYVLPHQGVYALGTPDGRAWFAIMYQNAPILLAQTLPDNQAVNLSATLAGAKLEPVATRGMSVQIQIGAGPEKFRSRADTALKSMIESQGFKIGPGGLTITASAQESATGKILDYEIRQFGKGKPQIVKIAERQVVCECTITDSQGVVAKNSQTYRIPNNIFFKGTDYERELIDTMWSAAESFGFTPLPTNTYRVGGQLIALPKMSVLQGGG